MTITEVILGRMSVGTALVYICGQFLGGFLSGIPVYFVYGQYLNLVEQEQGIKSFGLENFEYSSFKLFFQEFLL